MAFAQRAYGRKERSQLLGVGANGRPEGECRMPGEGRLRLRPYNNVPNSQFPIPNFPFPIPHSPCPIPVKPEKKSNIDILPQHCAIQKQSRYLGVAGA